MLGTLNSCPVDALLFDLGNVVVDIDFGRAFEVWARAAGVPAAVIAERFAFDQAYETHECGAIEGPEYFRSLRESLQIKLSDQQFLAGWNAIFVQPTSGMPQLLRTLASVMPLYLFSNTNALHHAFWSREYCSLLEHFSMIFCSHQLGARKPSPAVFRKVADAIAVAPCRLAFFDDLPENVDGARQAGLIGFHVTSVADLRRALVDELRIPTLIVSGAPPGSRH
ncbi:MAG TPA: HAD-IA family hydrolase [Burkholderiales bacterium]|nr:HAD-IA family hydrolase [Burkholderiales bacterium]